MDCRYILAPAFFAALLAAACAAGAKESPVIEPGNPFLTDFQANISAEEFIARALRPFDQMSPSGAAILTDDLNNKRATEAAHRRAGNVNTVLRNDLNGDFKVTEDEVLLAMQGIASRRMRSEPQSPEAIDRARANAKSFFAARDTNHDGVIDVPEAAVEPKRTLVQTERPSQIDKIAETSLGADGHITRAEVKKLAERTFTAVDRDRDGKISKEELQTVNAVRDTARAN
jgi:Ca2+-binding EF-hand superfamily protein